MQVLTWLQVLVYMPLWFSCDQLASANKKCWLCTSRYVVQYMKQIYLKKEVFRIAGTGEMVVVPDKMNMNRGQFERHKRHQTSKRH